MLSRSVLWISIQGYTLMMINQIWSVLSKGKPYAEATYSRKVDRTAFTDESSEAVQMLDLLCPFSDDLLRAYRVSELLDLVLRSPFADRVLQLDPINTYDKTSLIFPDPGVSVEITAQPTALRLFVFSDDTQFLAEGRSSVVVSCTVDTTTNTVSSEWNTSTYSVTGSLSSYVTIYPGIRVRMQSDFASASPYTFTAAKTVVPTTDYSELLSAAEASRPVWSDPTLEETWRFDPLWSNRLAAFVVSAVELCHNASPA